MSNVYGGSHPDVSVIFVSYNTRDLTLQAIASVFDSLVEPGFTVEIILVDNASHDGSPDAVRQQFPTVKVIEAGGNLGFGRGNNLGVESATGTALLLLNTDTIVQPAAIETMAKTLRQTPRCGVVGALLLNPDGSYQDCILNYPTAWRTFCEYFWLSRFSRWIPWFSGFFPPKPQRGFGNRHAVQVVHGAALMIPTELFRAVGGFDPAFFMYFEECDLCKRIADRGLQVIHQPDARVIHLISQSSRSHPWWFYKIIRRSRRVFARKHLTFPGRVLSELIVHAGNLLRALIYPIAGLVYPTAANTGKNIANSYIKRDIPISTGQ
ncbi:MAG: glycosyltransferase family 2 protein [Armatimonadetes bacterium]|nr:glycosyltransferase family 2 protein [Armatimonadota bacterium]